MEESQTEQIRDVQTRHIVVFGRHEYILKNTENLLQRAGYSVSCFLEKEEAVDFIRMNPVDGLLIGGGVEPHDRMAVKELVQVEFKHIRVIEHFGGPATILEEVNQAFRS